MNIGNAFAAGRRLVSDNSPAILTSIGVTGTVTTAYLSGKASFRAVEIIAKEWAAETDRRITEEGGGIPGTIEPVTFTLRERVEMVWPEYIPAFGVGALTVIAIVTANRLSSREAAALAAAYGVSERALTEYREKVVDKYGESKDRAVRDEIAQDRVTANPPKPGTKLPGDGPVLCMDGISGRYFMGSMEIVKRAENDVNFGIIHHMYASLSSFYEKIGLSPTSLSDEMGWNTNAPVQLSVSTALAPDDIPCLVVDFHNMPTVNYTNLY